jgi:hypothetical protein
MLQDVPELVDVAPVDQRGGAKRLRHRLVECLRTVEDHQQTAIRPQPATLEICQEALTHGRILGRAVPDAEGVFALGVIDAQRHDDAVLADVDAIDQQRHEVERVERGRPPGVERGGGLGDESAY